MPYWFDGNNLIGLSATAARADRRSRAAFLSVLSNWRRAGGGRFLVWFDGDDPADMMPPSGVAVRYSAPESADNAMSRSLRETGRPGDVIVVTNDRELASRCKNAGAAVLDWNRFILKMQTRSTAPARLSRQTAETNLRRRTDRSHRARQSSGDASVTVDVDDWLRFFGLKNKDC